MHLKNAYDRVLREILWWVLNNKKVLTKYVQLIKNMYERITTRVKVGENNLKEFLITISLHQGSALSSYLFVFIMDELTKDIHDEIPQCMLFADDIFLIDEYRKGVKNKLELWRNTFGIEEL